MRIITVVLCIGLCTVHSVFGYWNENRFEGSSLLWQNATKAQDRLEIIEQFLPENPIVFEVGGHNGTDSVRLSEKWPNGKIISFEANPNQFKSYEVKASKHKNMFGYNLAVNTFNGFTDFYLCWGSTGDNPEFEGASSLLKPSKEREIDYQGPVIHVPCVVFDDWCKENQVENVDFMWLDLEGFERQFISSSPNILSTVSVIYTETNFTDFRQGTTQFYDLKDFMEDLDFELIAHWYNEGLQGDAIFVRKSKL
jgi:FkbM family methyltransferase